MLMLHGPHSVITNVKPACLSVICLSSAPKGSTARPQTQSPAPGTVHVSLVTTQLVEPLSLSGESPVFSHSLNFLTAFSEAQKKPLLKEHRKL